MANKELYDYFSGATVTPDYSGATLSIFPDIVVVENASKNTVIHLGDDGSEERISFSTAPIFHVVLGWDNIEEDDAGTVFDFYNDPDKGNGMQRSFYWTHKGELTDQHTYVVRFNSDIGRELKTGNLYGFKSISFKILGAAR